MSDTPRTDSEVAKFGRLVVEYPVIGKAKVTDIVPTDFARQLERELAEARAIADRETKAAIHYSQSATRAEQAPSKADDLLREWLKKAEQFPELNEFRGGYQPFLVRATTDYLNQRELPHHGEGSK